MSLPIPLTVNQVSLAESSEPHRRVLSLHGDVGRAGQWLHTQEQAIDYIESRFFSYFLRHNGRAVRVVVGRTAAGEKFLKGETDGEIPSTLLNLAAALPNLEQSSLHESQISAGVA